MLPKKLLTCPVCQSHEVELVRNWKSVFVNARFKCQQCSSILKHRPIPLYMLTDIVAIGLVAATVYFRTERYYALYTFTFIFVSMNAYYSARNRELTVVK